MPPIALEPGRRLAGLLCRFCRTPAGLDAYPGFMKMALYLRWQVSER
jgi:hypothetical protein